MPARIRLIFSSLTAVLFLIPAASLYRELSQRDDIWWTPRTILVPPAESRDRVEIYARGRPVAALLEAGQLRISDDAGSSVLAPSDVGVRFNNWDRVRGRRLPLLLMYAAACGVAGLMFLLVLTGHLAYREEKERVD